MENSEKISSKELFRKATKDFKKHDFSQKIDRSEEDKKFSMESLETYGTKSGTERGNEMLKEVINEMCDDLKERVALSDKFYNSKSGLIQDMFNFQESLEKDEVISPKKFKIRQEINNKILENPQTSILFSFEEEIRKFGENKKFLEDILKEIDNLHTIEEWIEILNPKETPELWFKKLDEKLEEIEINDSFSDHIVEIENIRQIFRAYFNMVKWIPIISKCVQCSSCYFLELLRYGGFKRLSEYADTVKVEDGQKPHMLVTTVDKIMCTTYYMSMNIISNREIFINGTISSLKWGDREENEKSLSKQAFIEFNEYLIENDVFDLKNCTLL